MVPKERLSKFELRTDDILYHSVRLSELTTFLTKDLDLEAFFDNTEFTGLVPVTANYLIFFAYLMAVYTKIQPHAGVEITLREISKKMYVIDNPRRIIKQVRNYCIKCKPFLKKTMELEMSKHHFPCTMIALVFYNYQMYIVYGIV